MNPFGERTVKDIGNRFKYKFEDNFIPAFFNQISQGSISSTAADYITKRHDMNLKLTSML